MRNFIFITAAVYVFIIVFDIILHSILLTPLYRETQSHWRSVEDFKAYAPIFFLGKLVISAAFAAIYLQFRKSGTLREGALFGFFIGLLFAGRYMVTFATEQLFTLNLLLAWAFAYALFEHIVVGVIASALYKTSE